MTTVDLTNPIFTDSYAAREHFESIRWPDGTYCPFCGQTDTVRPLGGKSMGPGWYHCKDCRRKFTAQVGTMPGSSKSSAVRSSPNTRSPSRRASRSTRSSASPTICPWP